MLTLLHCGQGQNGISVSALIAAFKIRVATDSGNYSAETCQITTLNTLNI